MNDIRTLNEQLTGVRLDLARLETKLDAIKDLTRKVEEIDDLAKEALQSTRAAHQRIDELRHNEIKNIAENQAWLWRTVLAALIAGLINLLWKGVGS